MARTVITEEEIGMICVVLDLSFLRDTEEIPSACYICDLASELSVYFDPK